jgi:hypothetical protein
MDIKNKPVNLPCILMVRVRAEMKINVQQHDRAAHNSQGQSNNIYNGKKLISQVNPKG